jgi:Arc/MetJ-type ribon-helix-helix transcriptional regulator
MEIALSPELERLVRDRVARGEFESAEAMVESALRHFVRPAERLDSNLTPEERVKAWEEFCAEVDKDPPSDAPPLSDEALSRRNLYDDRRNRL